MYIYIFRLSFSLKRLRFLTAACFRRENTAIFTANERKSRELNNYMLDNLRKVDILQLSNCLRSKSKDI